MRKRLLKQLHKINRLMPNKLVRRQKFASKIKNRRKHERKYSQYSYDKAPKSSRFNRWNDYKRLNRRTY